MTQEAAVPAGLMQQIKRMIDEGVAAGLRSAPNRNSAISEGGSLIIKGGQLRVQYPSGQGGGEGVYFGDLEDKVTHDYVGTGLLIQSPEGDGIAEFRSDADTGIPLAVIRDNTQAAILFTDLTGDGFGRPWFSTGFYLSRNNDWPLVTSGTFETVYRARLTKQTAKLLVRVWGVNNTAGATGEIRVMVNNVQLGSTASTVSGTVAETQVYGAVAGAFGSTVVVEIQARLATGTGGVQVCPSELTARN